MSRPSIDAPVFDEPREHPGFACKRARLGRQTGSERTGLSLWEVPAGEAAYPYHWHFAEEEIVVVGVVYPDSNKVMTAQRAPDGSGSKLMFRIADAADYHLGEEAP